MSKPTKSLVSAFRKGLSSLRARIQSHIPSFTRKYRSVRDRPPTPYIQQTTPYISQNKPLPPVPRSLSTINIFQEEEPSFFPAPVPPPSQPTSSRPSSSSSLRARARRQHQQQQQPKISTEPMTQVILAEALSKLSAALSHIPHALCGRAALASWGYTNRPVRRLAVVVPESSRDVLRSWAAASGMHVHNDDILGLMTADGVLRKMSVRFVTEAEFAALRVVERAVQPVTPTQMARQRLAQERYHQEVVKVKVLSLSSLLECAAQAWHTDWRVRKRASLWRAVAEDCVWVLRRLVAEGRAGRLGPEDVTHITDRRFLEELVVEQPCALGLLGEVGLVMGRAEQVWREKNCGDDHPRTRMVQRVSNSGRTDSRYGWTRVLQGERLRVM